MWPFGSKAESKLISDGAIERAAVTVSEIYWRETFPTTMDAVCNSLFGNRSIDPAKKSEILIELAAYCFHLWDRRLFMFLGPEKRVGFLNILMMRFLEDYHGDAEIGEFASSFMELSDARQREYAKFRIPRDGNDLKGTLFWEFGKKMNATAQNWNPAITVGVAVIFMEHYAFISESLKTLETSGQLPSPRNI